jgi:hypothetical protein
MLIVLWTFNTCKYWCAYLVTLQISVMIWWWAYWKRLHASQGNSASNANSWMQIKASSYLRTFVVLYPGTKLHTWVQNFISRHKTAYLNTYIRAWMQNFTVGYKTSHLGKKLHTWVQNLIPGQGTSYLGKELHTWAKNFIPLYQIHMYLCVYKISYLDIKFHTSVQSFLPGYKIST